ncbi:MAG: hypothetical protein GY906_23510 [bacterium]|nr:hypothetical protein [bacterium]
MTSRIIDKFDRADGTIGTDYTVPCGGVIISDESVIPIDAEEIVSGQSPLFPAGVTSLKTQVLYTQEAMDGPDYVVRGTWAHDGEEPSSIDPLTVDTPSSFTLLARMSKDPLLYDLGVDEDPACYDQGYGARVTMPRDGSAPVLKIVKLMPVKRLPGMSRPSSSEVDGMVVLTSVTLETDDLNLDLDFDATTYSQGDVMPYKGYWQDMRLRIRRADNEVILDVYLNDRNLNQPKISFTDKVDPLWGGTGLPGFEFLSGQLATQPAGVSAFSLAGLSLLRCGIFSAETIRDVRRPVQVAPGTEFTYTRVTNRVITLVEKDGDAKYNATTGAATKFQTYLEFVMEAEADLIREEGYWQWLWREQKIYLTDGQTDYEFPADFGELDYLRPGNWNGRPLTELEPVRFYRLLQGVTQTGGKPHTFLRQGPGPNNQLQIKVFPSPVIEQVTEAQQTEDPYLSVAYFARQLFPYEPDIQIPFVPQEDIDVLIYAAASHALLLDTDSQNAQNMAAVYMKKSRSLRRKNNRNISNRDIARSAADVFSGNIADRVPLTRAASLGTLLAF